MKALTFTIIAGSMTCPNRCPICISKMTPNYGIEKEEPKVDWDKFEKSIVIASNHGVQNVLITGKGEPTLFPGQITRFLVRLKDHPFDKIELQTEGSMIASGKLDQFLSVWRDLGLETVAISMYHYDDEINNQMFNRPNEDYMLWDLIYKLHRLGFTVRLSCVLLKNGIDNCEKIDQLIMKTKANGVYQLTLREVSSPNSSCDLMVSDYINKNFVSLWDLKLPEFFQSMGGRVCDVLSHGASIFEVKGQNVCITNGLSNYIPNKEEEIRQLIFFPQGWLTTSWENVMGGRIL